MAQRTRVGQQTAPREQAPKSWSDSQVDRAVDQVEVEMLDEWFAGDEDDVDTAIIPRLATGGAVLVPVTLDHLQARPMPEPAAAAPVPTAAPAPTAAPEPTAAPAASTPAGRARGRSRHASAASADAVRRNLIALAVMISAIVLLGAVIGLIGGWAWLGGYALIVCSLMTARSIANRQHAPRHSRYTPRHA
ncbi:hypothetical protein [Marihabitans asiaticum]|nr:hypothetical protein [Marihabitans asiaticum]